VTTAFVPTVWSTPGDPDFSTRPVLRVVEGGGGAPAVRQRRLLVAVIAVLAVALALPLSGTGGRSHATGSAPAGIGRVEYTVQPGDTLWTIAQRVDPNNDPRPLVTKLAAQTGSDTVVPGERISLP
jgi:nucleoid-associated protein YgaU